MLRQRGLEGYICSADKIYHAESTLPCTALLFRTTRALDRCPSKIQRNKKEKTQFTAGQSVVAKRLHLHVQIQSKTGKTSQLCFQSALVNEKEKHKGKRKMKRKLRQVAKYTLILQSKINFDFRLVFNFKKPTNQLPLTTLK